MAAVLTPAPEGVTLPVPVPVRDWLPWAVFGALLAVLALYFVAAEQGATSLIGGHFVHELVHDARHLIGVPCH